VAVITFVPTIRPAAEADSDQIWRIFREVVAPGDTYAFDLEISQNDALAYWFARGTNTYVAEEEHRVVGTYILKPNHAGGGVHVANAGFMVAGTSRGKGVGRLMAEHCFKEARRLGFRAMQFNFVVATNEAAIKLWRDLGMKIVGTLPLAFHHPSKGYVDAYVMYRSLVD
jgi:L-amino acid N-acyltransferase YncA